jgi:hypothetical protein
MVEKSSNAKWSFMIDPLQNSQTLANWAARVLKEARLGEVTSWRMLEYWMQVELFRATQNGNAGQWSYLGTFEQPYYTNSPRSGSKYNIKWVDLVLAEPYVENPSRIAWIELKDIGRSHHRLMSNASGLGQDLAALAMLDPEKTIEVWQKPPEHIADLGRHEEWKTHQSVLKNASHIIGQIVLVPGKFANQDDLDLITAYWIKTFQSRVGNQIHREELAFANTTVDGFVLFALVHHLINLQPKAATKES